MNNKNLHIIFLAYRDWAMPILESVKKHQKVSKVVLCKNNEEYTDYHHYCQLNQIAIDLVMYCGWSEQPISSYLADIQHVGLHCAESDKYSAGTPLQNQIIDGLKTTKHRVFNVGYPELSLRQWSHETDIDLRHNISDVLEQLTVTGKLLYNEFLDSWPNIRWYEWEEIDQKLWKSKRIPIDSRLRKTDFQFMTTKQLYDFLRCLESPYPNAYVEDEHGKLYFEKVSYKEK